MFDLLCFFLIEVVVRSTMIPFDCVVASNGASVLAAEPSIACYVPGGSHWRMRIVAALTVVVFVIGTPALFALVTYRHRTSIVADQKLRQEGAGDSLLTNPHISIRHRYRKLYEDFRPQFTYWKVVLLTRKCLLAVVVVSLNNTALQVITGASLVLSC